MKLDLVPFRALLAAGAIAVAAPLAAVAADISGAGATFPYPIYAKWADAYKKETGVGLNYQSIGSGGGIKQIQAKTVVFGATDAPLSGAELDKSGLVQFPMVMGGIVPVVNLDGVKPGELVIDGPTLGQDIPRPNQGLGRRRAQEAQPQRQAAEPGDRGGPPLGRFRHHLQLHRLSRQGEPRLEVQGRLGDRGRVAGRHRRQGQRRRRQQRRQHQGLGRLRRICLCQAEQADLRQHDQQGRQDGVADLGDLPGRRRQCRLELGARLRRHPERPARRPVVADDRRDLHPHPQAAAGPGGRRRSPEVLRLGLCQGRQDGRGARLRPDAHRGRRRRREDVGRQHQGRGRQAAGLRTERDHRGRRRRRLPRQLPHRILNGSGFRVRRQRHRLDVPSRPGDLAGVRFTDAGRSAQRRGGSGERDML